MGLVESSGDSVGFWVIFGGIFWVIPLFVAVSQGKAKERWGFGYGFCLGWLGVLILAVLPPADRSVRPSRV